MKFKIQIQYATISIFENRQKMQFSIDADSYISKISLMNHRTFSPRPVNSLLFCLFCLMAFSTTFSSQAQGLNGYPDAAYESPLIDVSADPNFSQWMVLGPIPVFEGEGNAEDTETQKKAFDLEFLGPAELGAVKKGESMMVGGAIFQWKEVTAKEDVVDLAKVYGDLNFVIAYAWTEVVMPEETSTLLGIGSDDAVKVWLNGELIHENWIPRPLNKDDDLCPVAFRKGKNHLLLKVQNMEYDWSYSCRILPPESYTENLAASARRGDLDNMELLLSNGAEVDARTEMGLTPLQAAKISGREEAVKLLEKYGADTNAKMPPKEKLADLLFSNALEGEVPGAAALIAQNGKIIYEKGFGYANLEHGVPFTPETKSRIGSVTKQFTAAAILKLQEMGKINVNDPLSKYMPDFPRGEEVTIHHLLTHTSGIRSYTDKPDFLETVQLETSAEGLINSFKDDKYDFDPGTKWQYNNSAYFLLGHLIEKISGKTYGEFLREEFFEPLGMKNTGVYQATDILKNEAAGYSFIDGNLRKATNWSMSRAGGAGNLYSTVGDLFLWNEAVFNGKVLSEKSLEAAFTPVSLNDGSEASAFGSGYGYGWAISEYRGLKQIAHSGGLHGFVTYLARFPEQNVTIAVFHNAAPARDINPSQAAIGLAEIYLWEKMESQGSYSTDKSIDPAIFDDYVGRYEYPGGGILEVTKEEDNRLFAQMTGQPKFEIFPKTENEFYWKVVDAQITFVRNGQGEVAHAIHRQGGNEFQVSKMENEKPVEVDPAVYDAYTGEYELATNMIITISKEDGRLFAQLSGQPRFEIFPRSETVFFFKVVVADITFSKDDSGKVSSLTLNQGGREMTGKKME